MFISNWSPERIVFICKLSIIVPKILSLSNISSVCHSMQIIFWLYFRPFLRATRISLWKSCPSRFPSPYLPIRQQHRVCCRRSEELIYVKIGMVLLDAFVNIQIFSKFIKCVGDPWSMCFSANTKHFTYVSPRIEHFSIINPTTRSYLLFTQSYFHTKIESSVHSKNF